MGRGQVILDTHTLLWLITNSSSLGKKAGAMCDEALADNVLAVSAITWWEIDMLARNGRIELSQDSSSLREQMIESGLLEVPVDGSVGIYAATLQNFHGDPADRIITASAYLSGFVLLTADQKILEWEGSCARTDARK